MLCSVRTHGLAAVLGRSVYRQRCLFRMAAGIVYHGAWCVAKACFLMTSYSGSIVLSGCFSFLFSSQSINQSESNNLYTLFTNSYDLKTSPILWLLLADHDLHCSVHPTS